LKFARLFGREKYAKNALNSQLKSAARQTVRARWKRPDAAAVPQNRLSGIFFHIPFVF
jgi:hypothetical protein